MQLFRACQCVLAQGVARSGKSKSELPERRFACAVASKCVSPMLVYLRFLNSLTFDLRTTTTCPTIAESGNQS